MAVDLVGGNKHSVACSVGKVVMVGLCFCGPGRTSSGEGAKARLFVHGEHLRVVVANERSARIASTPTNSKALVEEFSKREPIPQRTF